MNRLPFPVSAIADLETLGADLVSRVASVLRAGLPWICLRARRASRTTREDLARRLLDLAGGDADRITGPLITEAARAGDPFSVEQLATLGHWLGEGIASLAAILDPAVCVIGGGVSEAGDLLLQPVRQAFSAQLTGRGHRPSLEIRKARLGNRAGLIGAADLARH